MELDEGKLVCHTCIFDEPFAPPLSRAEVVRVLSESWKASVVFGRGRKSAAIVNYYSARSDEVRSLASALNLSAAFERAIAKEGGA